MSITGAKFRVAVATGISDSIVSEAILANFIDLLEPMCERIYAITGKLSDRGDKVSIIRIRGWEEDDAPLLKIFKYWLIQVKICFQLIRISKDIDIVILHFGTRGYVLPLLFAKIFKKKTVSCFTGLASPTAKLLYGRWLFGLGGFIFPFVARILERINLFLADQVAVESPSGITSMDLGPWRAKITINGAMYVDTNSFKADEKLPDREDIVGYIGRLASEKGVKNLVKAIPSILEGSSEVKFLIGGNGPLFNQLKAELEENGSNHNTEMVDWIPHENLPRYLNRLKLICFPSFDGEGLPGIVQEAMACGTPVLATPVGGVPDLVRDGETGFIMKDNSPRCIASNIARALKHPNLEEIGQNARRLIEEDYAFRPMVKKCRVALNKLAKEGK